MISQEAQDKFWGRIDRSGGTDACWEWIPVRRLKEGKPKGYFMFSADGKMTQGHRIAYTLAKGEIPDGMVVRHACDNPPCVNPNHLRLGTRADNARDARERIKFAKPETRVKRAQGKGDVHYHVWTYRDQGVETRGGATAMFRKSHPFRTKQAAWGFGNRRFGALYAMIMPCKGECCVTAHKCRDYTCPDERMRHNAGG